MFWNLFQTITSNQCEESARWKRLSIFFLANEIFKLAVFLLDHHWILLLINYSERKWTRTLHEPSLKFGELRDVLSPGHRIHDRRIRGRRSDLLKLPIIAPGTTTRVNACWGDSRWYDISWCYHVNKCRAIRGNRSDIAPSRKSPRCHVNKPLGFTGVAFLKVPGYRFSNWASRLIMQMYGLLHATQEKMSDSHFWIFLGI